jgi:hypothetical protein
VRKRKRRKNTTRGKRSKRTKGGETVRDQKKSAGKDVTLHRQVEATPNDENVSYWFLNLVFTFYIQRLIKHLGFKLLLLFGLS